ncbi:MAG TPA: glycosyltransferase family 39 protein [Gemmatimonadaceae bacterium]
MRTTAARARQAASLARAFLADRRLVACGIVALVVLAPGAGWGIPQATSAVTVRGWEVDAISGIGVLSELSNLTSAGRPDWYVAYPLFHYVVLAAVYLPYLALQALTGGLSSPGPDFPYGFADPVRAFVVLNGIGHAVSVVMGVVAIMAVFVLARRVFGATGAWLAAAAALCCAPFVFYARTGNLDVPALCWTMLAFVVIERCWSDGLTMTRAMACGTFSAFAVATKDQSFGLLVLPLLLLLIRSVRSTAAAPGRYRLPIVLVASGAIAFLVAGGLVVRPDRFVRHVEYITNFSDTFTNVRHPTELTVMRPPTIAGRALLLGDLLRATGTAIGWPIVLTGIAGLALLWRSTNAVRWMVAALAGYFLLVLVPIQHMQYRYALAPAMLLAIVAGGVVARLTRRPALIGGAAVVLVGPAVAGAAEITHAMLTDARGPASDWLRQHADSGDSLGFFGRPHQLPRIPAGVHVEALPDDDAHARLMAEHPRWIVVAPDYFADPRRERSIFLPEELYRALQTGSIGWELAARFESRGLLGRALPYLPYVNPVVQIYERRRAD